MSQYNKIVVVTIDGMMRDFPNPTEYKFKPEEISLLIRLEGGTVVYNFDKILFFMLQLPEAPPSENRNECEVVIRPPQGNSRELRVPEVLNFDWNFAKERFSLFCAEQHYEFNLNYLESYQIKKG